MNEVPAVFVLIAGALLGAFVATFMVHFFFSRALDRALAGADDQLRRLAELDLAPRDPRELPYPELDVELAAKQARELAQSAAAGIHGATPAEVNAGFAAALPHAQASAYGFPSTKGAPAALASKKRGCSICARARALLGW